MSRLAAISKHGEIGNILRNVVLVFYDNKPILWTAIAMARGQKSFIHFNLQVTMLPNNDIVKHVFTDPSDGVLSGLQKGSFLIDSSTVDPAVSKEVADLAKKAGADCFVDAPVSGKLFQGQLYI